MKKALIVTLLLLLGTTTWAQNYRYSAFLAEEGITLEGIELIEQLNAIEDGDEQRKFFKNLPENKRYLYAYAVGLESHQRKKLSYLTREQEEHVKNARKELINNLPEGTLWCVFVKNWWSNETLYTVYFLKLDNTESSWVVDNRFK